MRRRFPAYATPEAVLNEFGSDQHISPPAQPLWVRVERRVVNGCVWLFTWCMSLIRGPAWVKKWKEEREYAEANDYNRGEFRGAKCARLVPIMARALAMVACFSVAVLLFKVLVLDPDVDLGTTLGDRLGFVTHGANGVNLRTASGPFTCHDLSANSTGLAGPSLEAVHTALTDLLEDRPCLCGPLIGVQRQIIALRFEDGVRMLYNPTLDETWGGELPDGPSLRIEEVLVDETQERWFPTLANPPVVAVRRQRPIRVLFRDTTCNARAMILDRPYAYCVQTCVDLFHGLSIYDRVATAAY